MNLSLLIRVWGLIDLFYIIWVIYIDLLQKKIPFFDTFVNLLNVSSAFEHVGILTISILSFVCSLTIIISGYLMLKLNKFGIYISFIQAPFRLLLAIPPTLFFIPNLGEYFSVSHWLVWAAIVLFEIFKIVSQIKWLKLKSYNKAIA